MALAVPLITVSSWVRVPPVSFWRSTMALRIYIAGPMSGLPILTTGMPLIVKKRNSDMLGGTL